MRMPTSRERWLDREREHTEHAQRRKAARPV